jgi:hypothetical protein
MSPRGQLATERDHRERMAGLPERGEQEAAAFAGLGAR